MPRSLGVYFGRGCFWGPEALEKQGRKICGKKLPSNFSEKFAFSLKIRQAKTNSSPQIRSAELRDQNIAEIPPYTKLFPDNYVSE